MRSRKYLHSSHDLRLTSCDEAIGIAGGVQFVRQIAAHGGQEHHPTIGRDASAIKPGGGWRPGTGRAGCGVGAAGGRKGGAQPAEKGIRKAAKELGVSRRDAPRAVMVDKLAPEAKQVARDVGLDDNESALLRAAKRPTKEEQVRQLREDAADRDRRRDERTKPAPAIKNAFESEEDWRRSLFTRRWTRSAYDPRWSIANGDSADMSVILGCGGVPCESYLDTGNRAAFMNGGKQDGAGASSGLIAMI